MMISKRETMALMMAVRAAPMALTIVIRQLPMVRKMASTQDTTAPIMSEL